MRRSSALVVAVLSLCPTAVLAHDVAVDGLPSEWFSRAPNASNLGIVERNAQGQGELVWVDVASDARSDLAAPEVVGDVISFQVTGSPTSLSFLVRRPAGVALSGAPIQVQVAIDLDRVDGSGAEHFANFADTKVASAARWERLVATRFGSGAEATVLDTSFSAVGTGAAAQGADGSVEISVAWSTLGLGGPPAAPLRFTVAIFRAQANDLTVDIGGSNVSNALDVVTDYGDPAPVPSLSTWAEVGDQVVGYWLEAWFDARGEVYAPLVVQRFLANASAAGPGEWYAVRNVTAQPLPLEGYKLGDEETPDGSEGMFSFPAGATLAPGASFTVARDAAAYQAFYGAAPDAELPPGGSGAVPDMVPFLPWTGGTVGTMALDDAGDELLVLSPSNTVLDVAVFGTGAYPWIGSCLAPGKDAILSRNAASADTDDCTNDFADAGHTCTADAQCGSPCLQCAGGACVAKPQGAACPDANPCDGEEICDGQGACVPSAAPACDDQNPCTIDSCSPVAGCAHSPVAGGTSCSDGSVCNGAEVCDEHGSCLSGTALWCSTDEPCAQAGCDPVAGCVTLFAAEGAPCDDGDACTEETTCDASHVCGAGQAVVCNDDNACTTDTCDPQTGCAATPNPGASCTDGDPCTSAETCSSQGHCGGGAPVSCDDANECTTDRCSAAGCGHEAVADGTECTSAACGNAICRAGSCTCAPDAGPAMTDGGAGLDVGVATDAGVETDAGDASVETDAAIAAEGPDAQEAPPDAAASRRDAGSMVLKRDAGDGTTELTGCGCGAAGSGAEASLAFLALVLSLRRREKRG
ncbi:MAG: MYXO-CTERM sorting domain-containing protein [Myxococcales bacterium]